MKKSDTTLGDAGRKVNEMGTIVAGSEKPPSPSRTSEPLLSCLSRLIDHVGEGIALFDLEGRVLYVNPAWAEMHGRKAEGLVGEHVSVFHDEEQYRDEVTLFFEAVKTFDRNTGEVGHKRQDGSRFPTEMTTTLLRNEAGEPTGFVGFARDITARKQAEDNLLQNEAKYRTLVESLPQRIFFKDKESIYVACNRNFAQDLGISQDEIGGKTDHDFFPKELAEKYRADDARIMNSGETEELDEQYLHGEQERFIHTVKTPLKDLGGDVVGVLGIFWDVTERREWEQRLLESEKKYRNLAENLGQLVYRADPLTFQTTYVNSVVEELFGYPADVWLSNPQLWEESIHIEDKERVFAEFAEARKHLDDLVVEYRVLTRDNAIRWVEDHVTWEKNPEGQPVSMNGVMYDITRRKQAEEALRESEKRHRLVSELASDWVYEISVEPDGQMTVEMVGEGFIRTTGYTGTEVRSPEMWAKVVHPEDLDRFMEFLESASAGASSEAEVRVISRRGETRWMSIFARPEWVEEPRRVIGIVGAAKDITDRKNAEQALELKAEALARSNAELDAFAYSVSHDLRAPLRSMDGFSQAVFDDYGAELDDEGRRYLERIRAASQRMGQLIDDLLGLSRVTRGEIRRERVDLTGMAREIAGELEKAHPRRRVQLSIAQDLTADGDPRLLRQMLANLLENAWKFTERQRKARIKIGKTEIDGLPTYYVRDNGAGFNMDYADKLFAPFQRLHHDSEFAGSGIGLATVQRIIHRHGGHVRAEAAEGKGAAFYFTLPESGRT